MRRNICGRGSEESQWESEVRQICGKFLDPLDPQLVQMESKILRLSQLCVSCFTKEEYWKSGTSWGFPPFTKLSYETLPNNKGLCYLVMQYPNHDIYDFDIKSEDLKSWKRYQYGSWGTSWWEAWAIEQLAKLKSSQWIKWFQAQSKSAPGFTGAPTGHLISFISLCIMCPDVRRLWQQRLNEMIRWRAPFKRLHPGAI